MLREQKSADNSNDIYIYTKMDPGLGYQKLINNCEDHINRRDDESARFRGIKNNGQKLWHIRESNVPGMLTVDVVQWNAAKNEWNMQSFRMALTKNGWVNANAYSSNKPEHQEERRALMKALEDKENVTPENASQHKASLEKYISEKLGLSIENRINPLKNEQTTSELYSTYAKIGGGLGSAKVKLSPGVTQALTCEITQKPFKRPVVMNVDKNVNTPDGSTIGLRKGQSYEQSALESLGVSQTEFYPNFLLKRIADSIGSLDKLKITELDERRLEDPVLLDQMKDPRVIPSGHSYSQETISGMARPLTCPNTRIPFRLDEVVVNQNLAHFIREWPACKTTLLQTLERERPLSPAAAPPPPAKL